MGSGPLNRASFLGEHVVRLTAAGGVAIEGCADVSAAAGEQMMAVRLALDAGFYHPWHNHPAHESMGVVLEGTLEMRIGDQTVQLGPGDTWHHPPGVFHSTRALEPTLAVECHAPIRQDLLALTTRGRRTPNG